MAGAVKSRPNYRTPDCDLTMRYKNPHATSELVIPVHLVCNTPDDILVANIKENAKAPRAWLGCEPLKSVPAIFCGSGPSLADGLAEIDDIRAQGGIVFATNGAANFLASKGIVVDYQVICDAREATGDLIGPAKNHLFASQVHPSLFEKKPDAILYHIDIGPVIDMQTLWTTRKTDYVIVGSNGSVGNVALTLAYAMGYREFHVFGFDSSFRDNESHAMAQPMNALEPVCDVEYGGKKYHMTFTMKSAADVFPRLADDLTQLGCEFHIYGKGYLQDRWFGELAKPLEQREREKYQAMWNFASYLDYSPGLTNLKAAQSYFNYLPGNSVIDFGCGAGFVVKELVETGVKARGIDIAPNALAFEIPFTEACLWNIPDIVADYGYCCDVMEHIPTEKVSDVLAGISRSVLHGCFFAIDDHPDSKGALIGAKLHLTIKPIEWWLGKLQEHFASVTFVAPNVYICRKTENDG